MLYVNSNLRKIQIDDCIKFVSHSAYQMQVSLYESEIGISIHMHASYKVLQLSFWTLFVPSLLWLFHLYTHRSLFADTPPCHCLWPEELFENTHFYCNCFAFTQSSLYRRYANTKYTDDCSVSPSPYGYGFHDRWTI